MTERDRLADEIDRLAGLLPETQRYGDRQKADLAVRIVERLLVMRATREGTTHPYDNGCVDAIDQSIAIVHEEASDDRA